MKQTYNSIPLELLMKKDDFEKAINIYLTGYILELDFIDTYLSQLRPDTGLYLRVESMDKKLAQYLNQNILKKNQQLRLYKTERVILKELLIELEGETICLLTTTNFTVQGIASNQEQHELYFEKTIFRKLQQKYSSGNPPPSISNLRY